ncbi:hypothetical protein ACJZ2D_006192 [Fusarium nematophilum]
MSFSNHWSQDPIPIRSSAAFSKTPFPVMSRLGITVLYEGRGPIAADVVFVHGLGGTSLGTWSVDRTVWPRDFLKEKIPNARIMTWGYKNDPIHFFSRDGQSQQSILSHSRDLFTDLNLERETEAEKTRPRRRGREDEAEKTRPIVFVGHSLGGLVIKQALIKAREYQGQRRYAWQSALGNHCAGIVFMGTPHRGADLAAWGATAVRLAQAMGKSANDEIVASLKSGSPVLESLQDSFAGIQNRYNIHTVLEAQAMHGIGKVVEDYFARLDCENEECFSIAANHRNMCKFSSSWDPGYRRVAAALKAQMRNVSSSPGVSPVAKATSYENMSLSSTPPLPTIPPPLAPPPSSETPQTGPSPLPASDLLSLSEYRRLYELAKEILGPLPPERYVKYSTRRGWSKSWTAERGRLFQSSFSPTDMDMSSHEYRNKLLCLASWAGDLKTAEACVAAGADGGALLWTDGNRPYCPLFSALAYDRTLIVELLYKAGATLERCEQYGMKEPGLLQAILPTMSALTFFVVVKFRGKEAFDPNAIGVLLAQGPHEEGILEAMISAGFKYDGFGSTVAGKEGIVSSVHLAAAANNVDDIRILVQRGVSIHSTFGGMSPLMYALSIRDLMEHTSVETRKAVITELVAFGANINYRAPEGYTVLDVARRTHPDLVPFLRSKGAVFGQDLGSPRKTSHKDVLKRLFS